VPSGHTLTLFLAASFLIAIAPGPSNLYVFTRTLAHGRLTGLLSAGGLALGGLAHTIAAALGLSALFVYSPTAFMVLKYVGAAYLVYLGIRTVATRPDPSGTRSPAVPAARPGARRLVLQAALTEILNPKVALFFLAFLPQFVEPNAGPAPVQLLLLGLAYTLVALPCDAMVAMGGHSIGRMLVRNAYVRRLLEWLCGSVLVGLGLRLAASGPH